MQIANASKVIKQGEASCKVTTSFDTDTVKIEQVEDALVPKHHIVRPITAVTLCGQFIRRAGGVPAGGSRMSRFAADGKDYKVLRPNDPLGDPKSICPECLHKNRILHGR